MSEALQKAIVKDFSENRLSFGFLARTSSNNPISSFLNKTNSHYDPLQAIERDANSPYIDNNGGSIWALGSDAFSITSKYECFAEHENKKEKERNGGYTDEQLASWEFARNACENIELSSMHNFYGGETVQVIDRSTGSSINVYYDKHGAVAGGDDGYSCMTAEAVNNKFLLNSLTDTPIGSLSTGASLIRHQDQITVIKDSEGNILGGHDNFSSLSKEAVEQVNFYDNPKQKEEVVASSTPVPKTSILDERDAQVAGWVARDKQLAETKAEITTDSTQTTVKPTVAQLTKSEEPMEIVITGGASSVTNKSVYSPAMSGPSI